MLGESLKNLAVGSFSNPHGIFTPAPIQQISQLQSFACGIINWVFWFLIIVSIIMFLVGGYRYATSGGNPERVRDANKTLLYGVIGVAVAIIANSVPPLVGSFFGAYGISACGIFAGLLGGFGI